MPEPGLQVTRACAEAPKAMTKPNTTRFRSSVSPTRSLRTTPSSSRHTAPLGTLPPVRALARTVLDEGAHIPPSPEWHEISLGHVNSSAPHVVPAGHHSNSSLATRGVLSAIDDALFGAPSWTIGADVNYDSIGKQPVLDTIPFFAAIKFAD